MSEYDIQCDEYIPSNATACMGYPTVNDIDWANDMLSDIGNKQYIDTLPSEQESRDYYNSIIYMEM